MSIGNSRTHSLDDVRRLDLSKFAAYDGTDFVRAGFLFEASYFRTFIAKWGFSDLGTVADLGCGYGRWSFFLAETNSSVYGFDQSQKRIDLGQELAEDFGLRNICFSKSDFTSLERPDAEFNGVWCFNTLQVANRAKTLSEVSRVLRVGAPLFLGRYDCAGKVLEMFFKGYSEGGISHRLAKFALRSMAQGPMFDDGPANFADPASIGDVFKRYGFAVDPDYPMEVAYAAERKCISPFAPELQDLPSLAVRLQSDCAFAAEFATHPEAANLLPMSVNLRVIKQQG